MEECKNCIGLRIADRTLAEDEIELWGVLRGRGTPQAFAAPIGQRGMRGLDSGRADAEEDPRATPDSWWRQRKGGWGGEEIVPPPLDGISVATARGSRESSWVPEGPWLLCPRQLLMNHE